MIFNFIKHLKASITIVDFICTTKDILSSFNMHRRFDMRTTIYSFLHYYY